MAHGTRSNNKAAGKKLHILQGLPLANSKHYSENRADKWNAVILGYLLCICKLKLGLEVMRREYMRVMTVKKQYLQLLEKTAVVPKVTVNKVSKGYYEVKVTSERKGDMLMSTLEAFESVGLDVLQARVSSEKLFSMDALAVARDHGDLDASVVTQQIIKALKRHEG
ncbi:hypothetical protein MLD38_010302 [Melastoma candidum]|uniref:Uncharacterized protein n=1 Tax=Melastoma candidum TaxID=119954 RepID=A0ACB9QZJ3_9MYRT|nr:hypothetical protein MLD38_010302 [Melastoma candidum]